MGADVTQALAVHALHVRAQLLQAGEGLAACACCVARGAAPPRHVLQLTVQRRPPQVGNRVTVVHLVAGGRTIRSHFSQLADEMPGSLSGL